MPRQFDTVALGHRIRTTRKRARLTQEQLASMVGISLPFLGHVERGTRIPSAETLVSFANVLHVPVDFLLADSLTYRIEE